MGIQPQGSKPIEIVLFVCPSIQSLGRNPHYLKNSQECCSANLLGLIPFHLFIRLKYFWTTSARVEILLGKSQVLSPNGVYWVRLGRFSSALKVLHHSAGISSGRKRHNLFLSDDYFGSSLVPINFPSKAKPSSMRVTPAGGSLAL